MSFCKKHENQKLQRIFVEKNVASIKVQLNQLVLASPQFSGKRCCPKYTTIRLIHPIHVMLKLKKLLLGAREL